MYYLSNFDCRVPIAICLFQVATYAQQPPYDSGSIVRDNSKTSRIEDALTPSTLSLKVSAPVVSDAPSGGPSVKVLSVTFYGNTVYSNRELSGLLVDAVGGSFDLSGLQDLAARITAFYRNSGYPFAQAIVPPQDLQYGILLIRIVEGRYGRVSTHGESTLAVPASKYLKSMSPGGVIKSSDIEQSLLLLSEVPGLRIKPVFSPGLITGTADLRVEIQESEFLGGSVRLDNHGSRFTGEYRSRLEIYGASLIVFGDRLSGRAMITDENLYLGDFRYDYALGVSGWRGYLGFSRTDYQLGAGFDGFTGIGEVWSAGLTYPLVRTQRSNFILNVGGEDRRLEDSQGGVVYERRSGASGVVGLQFDRRDADNRGILFGEAKLAAGQVESNVSNVEQGTYSKLFLQLATLKNLGESLGFFGSVSGQLADQPLNGSEDFSLGGATGVRSYPSGEGQGAAGFLVQTELRYNLGDFIPFVLCDYGEILSFKGDDARSLGGAGLGLRWSTQFLSAELVCVWKTQGGESVADSEQRNPRIWLSASCKF